MNSKYVYQCKCLVADKRVGTCVYSNHICVCCERCVNDCIDCAKYRPISDRELEKYKLTNNVNRKVEY